VVIDLLYKSLNLTDNLSTEYIARVFDLSGRELKMFNIKASETSIDISSLPKSVYFIKISSGLKEYYFKKFIKIY